MALKKGLARVCVETVVNAGIEYLMAFASLPSSARWVPRARSLLPGAFNRRPGGAGPLSANPIHANRRTALPEGTVSGRPARGKTGAPQAGCTTTSSAVAVLLPPLAIACATSAR